MSSERPGGDPSPELDLAALLRLRGAPLVEALELHMRGSREHAEATGSYTFAACVELSLGRSECEAAREAAVLHEVGQVYVPAAILAKAPAERDELEAAAVDSHFEAGYRLGRGAGIPEQACAWILRARERYDGGGPEGLAGEAIPLISRIIRAACVCQTALAQPGADGRPPSRIACAALDARAGDELDPQVVAALISVVERASASA